eukprot:gene10466-21836_t
MILILCLLLLQEKVLTFNVGSNSNRFHRTIKPLNSIQTQVASLSILLSLSSSPLGNLGEALKAIINNPESVTCVLDTQQASDEHGTCQQLPEVVRVRGGRVLTIKQDWGGSISTGAAVWNGANMMSWYMENKINPVSLRGASVLELGAGVGFSSLVANSLGAKNVVITDGNEDVLKLADENIKINVPSELQEQVYTSKLRWGTDDEEKFTNKQWDYIIASDVTYRKDSWPVLMGTISRLSGPKTTTLLSMEPRNIGEIEGVLAEAENHGMQWREEKLPIDKNKELCDLLCARLFTLHKNPDAISSYVVSTFLPLVEY